MSATDELRAMLDARGVEWEPSVWSAKDETFYKVGDVGFLATEMSSGKMKVGIEGYITTAQAVEATLGRGECEIEYVIDWMGWHCKSCGTLWQGLKDQPPKFCKECGRAVKQ